MKKSANLVNDTNPKEIPTNSSPQNNNPIYKIFSISSFVIMIINLGFFSWFSWTFITGMNTEMNRTIKTVIFCLFLGISIVGIVIGAVSLNKGKKWFAIIGTALTTTGSIWLGWTFVVYLHFYYGVFP
jgi:hypothetical protein